MSLTLFLVGVKKMTIRKELEKAVNELKKNQIDEPMQKARIVLANVLQKEKCYLISHEEEELIPEISRCYQEKIEKLEEGVPLQYLTGYQEFRNVRLYVNEQVLIPRADTEILVEEVVKYSNRRDKLLSILDLCTGSGAISISLAKEIKTSKIVGSDISKEAIKVATRNAVENQVSVQWCISNVFENIKEKFDCIVSNPPYIRTKVIQSLSKEVKNEPILALDGGEDGLFFYQKIVKEASNYLKEKGMLFLEIGYDQKEEVTKLIKETGNYEEIVCKKDLGGNDRVIIAKKR